MRARVVFLLFITALVMTVAGLTLSDASSAAQPTDPVDPDNPFGADAAELQAPVASLNATFSDFYGVGSIPSDDPSDLEIDPETGYMWRSRTYDTVIVGGEEVPTDQHHIVDVVRLDGTPVMTVGTRGSAPGQIETPTSISIQSGEAIISDFANRRISIFTTAGAFLRTIDNEGDRPCGNTPRNSRLFVSSYESRTLRVFNLSTGALINSVDGSASGTPYGDWSCSGNNTATHAGEVYIADALNDRIMVFDTSLNWKRDIAVDRPGAIDIEADLIWVTDKFGDRIRQLTLDGVEVGLFDVEGDAIGAINFPLAIEVDEGGSTFWVADDNNLRTQAFTKLTCHTEQLTMVGSSASETMNGTSGNDVIHLGAGDDISDTGTGDDIVCAGAGNDLVSLFEGNDTVYGEDGDDKLFGGQGVDLMFGDAGADTLHGNRGDDNLNGGDGDDRIFGYSQNDTINGGDGNDRLHGHFGDDIVNGGDGDDALFGYGDDDTLIGGAGDDLMSGNFGDDFLSGGDDNDQLFGSDGADEVNGGDGNDTVDGNSGNDTIRGGNGNDTMDGGINVDVCSGGNGVDTAARCETITGVP